MNELTPNHTHMNTTPSAINTDQGDLYYMQQAYFLATQAEQHNEIPVGAVVVYQGKIIGRGFNQSIMTNDPSAHAEMLAIREAGLTLNNYRLLDCTLYVTLEPCIMCFGLIHLSRMKGMVFGTTSPLFGFGYGNNEKLPLVKTDLIIKEGVLKKECTEVLQRFFQNIRKRKDSQ